MTKKYTKCFIQIQTTNSAIFTLFFFWASHERLGAILQGSIPCQLDVESTEKTTAASITLKAQTTHYQGLGRQIKTGKTTCPPPPNSEPWTQWVENVKTRSTSAVRSESSCGAPSILSVRKRSTLSMTPMYDAMLKVITAHVHTYQIYPNLLVMPVMPNFIRFSLEHH